MRTTGGKPLDVRVTYYACDDANTFCVPVTQRYAVHLEVDSDAGRVFGAWRPGLRGGRFGGRGPGAMVDRMMGWDANEDGIITRDEAPERMRDRFDSIDANGDGMLDTEELENMPPPSRGRGAPGGGGSIRPSVSESSTPTGTGASLATSCPTAWNGWSTASTRTAMMSSMPPSSRR